MKQFIFYNRPAAITSKNPISLGEKAGMKVLESIIYLLRSNPLPQNIGIYTTFNILNTMSCKTALLPLLLERAGVWRLKASIDIPLIHAFSFIPFRVLWRKGIMHLCRYRCPQKEGIFIGSHKPRSWVFATLLSLALGSQAGSAYGATCSVSSSSVNFGVYDVFSLVANDSVGDISVACTGVIISILVSYNILLSTGGGSYALRSMASGSNHITYNLYTNSSRSIVWGNGSPGTAVVSDGYLVALFTVTLHYPIYGRILARQNVPTGNYSDMLTITVNY